MVICPDFQVFGFLNSKFGFFHFAIPRHLSFFLANADDQRTTLTTYLDTVTLTSTLHH